MGATRLTIEENARDWVDDTDASHYSISGPRLHKIVESEMQELASRLDLGPVWDTDAIALVDGTKDYELPNASNEEYQRILIIKRAEDEHQLTRVTPDAMERFYQGDEGSSFEGEPTHYTLWEEHSGNNLVINIRLYPTPGADEDGDYLDLLVATVPSALSADASLLPFSVPMLRAFEKKIAATMYRLMSQDERERRKISGDIVGMWENGFESAVLKERIRINRQRRIQGFEMRVGT